MQYENDKKNFQGRPFDFYGFDETTEFLESQVRFVIGWNRTTIPGQKCRVLMTFNPPMDETGEWVTRFFAPWLDETHPHPAQDGELRWFAMVDGQEIERPDSQPFEHDGETITPKSRTFFHAKLSDNPILEATGYGSTIDAMPEPIRTLLKGKFGAYKIVDPFQVIPAAWVRAAQERWNNSEPGAQITAIGVDVARGGNDQTVLAPLRADRFDELIKYPGAATPDGKTVSLLAEQAIPYKQTPKIGVDVIGVGAAAYDAMNDGKRTVIGVNFGAGSDKYDKSKKFKFANLRAEAYWKLREALDPDYGATLALPPDKELLGDLCSPKWEVRTGRIYIESKEEIIKRLGRSPDCGDAVAIALWSSSAEKLDWEGSKELGHVKEFKKKWE
jgi:Terminase-like family.